MVAKILSLLFWATDMERRIAVFYRKIVRDYSPRHGSELTFYLEGPSIREISKRLHHGRPLVCKAIDHAQPDRYQLKQQRPAPVLALYKSKINALIVESKKMPGKQRYTAHKIYQLLQADGYQGSEGNVHNYVSQQGKTRKHHQAYLPLEFEPGQDA